MLGRQNNLMIRRFAQLVPAALLAACHGTSGAPPAASTPNPPAFVEAACGGCHAVEPPFLSPNPHAPSFAAIANREGLSEATLTRWLTDAHNYPEMMDFTLEAQHIEEIAGHMIALRREDYRPVPQ